MDLAFVDRAALGFSAGDEPLLPELPEQPVQRSRSEQRPAGHGRVHRLEHIDPRPRPFGQRGKYGTGGGTNRQMPLGLLPAGAFASILHYLQF